MLLEEGRGTTMVTKYRHKIFPEKVYNDLTDLVALLTRLSIYQPQKFEVYLNKKKLRAHMNLGLIDQIRLQEAAQNYCRPINEATAYEE